MERPLYSPALRRVAMGACSVLVVLLLLRVCYAMPGQSAPALAVTALALAVGIGGIGLQVASSCQTHVPSHIFAKTRLRDRAQLVEYAFRHGLSNSQPWG
ncbi:MAG TPA: hypothetical protein VF070_13750 [Streptosporangiaceae bacterium]